VPAAINGEQPDQVPVDLGGTAASGINVVAHLFEASGTAVVMCYGNPGQAIQGIRKIQWG
jgi:hypothetical protein